MAKVIIIEGTKATVIHEVAYHVAVELKNGRVYDTHNDDKFSKDLRRALLDIEINKLKRELYLVDEG